MVRKKKKSRYLFQIGVLDSYTNDKSIDIKNLDSRNAKISMEELIKKFG